MFARTLIGTTLAGMVATVALAANSAGAEMPAPSSTKEGSSTMACFSPKGDRYDEFWQSSFRNQGNILGWGHFKSYGEILEVTDQRSNGWRINVDLQTCVNGRYTHFGSFDSGPNEGPVDKERHNLEIDEWRKIRFMVCEKQGSDTRYCSGWKYGHA